MPGSIYDEVTTARAYSRLNAVAHVTLGGGWPVVVDAAILCRSERAQFAALAALLAVPFSIFDCRAALPLLRQRLEQRRASGADSSEADVAVLERLSEADERLDEREHAVAIIIDAAQPVPSTALARCGDLARRARSRSRRSRVPLRRPRSSGSPQRASGRLRQMFPRRAHKWRPACRRCQNGPHRKRISVVAPGLGCRAGSAGRTRRAPASNLDRISRAGTCARSPGTTPRRRCPRCR